MENVSTDFFNEVNEDELNAASSDIRQGGSTNPFAVGVPVEVMIEGSIKLVKNDGIEETEAVITIMADDGRSFDVALGTTLYLGDKADLYTEARSAASEERTEDQKKTMKFAAISRSKLHALLSATLPSYETRTLEKVGKKWVASDLEGNPMDKEQSAAADVLREAKLNRVITAWGNGQQLGILDGKKVTYTPSENKKNANFPYHNFSAV